MKGTGSALGPQRARALLELVLELGELNAAVVDTELRHQWVHNAGSEPPESSILGKTDADLFSEELAAPATAIKREAIETATRVEREFTFQKPWGYKQYRGAAAPILEEGQVDGAIFAATDLTDEYRFLDRTTDGVYRVDQDWTVIYWNERIAERVDVAPAEILGENLWSVFGDTIPGSVQETFREAMRTGEPAEVDEYLPEPMGYWVELRLFPDDDGLTVYSRDVSARVEHERALEREKARAEEYFESAGNIMVVLDPAGQVRRINSRGCEKLGYEAERLQGSDWLETVVPEAQRSAVEDTFERIVRGEGTGPEIVETPLETADGEILDIEWHNTPVTDQDGTVIEVLASGIDVTERNRTQARLQKREEILRELHATTELLLAAETEPAVFEHMIEAVRTALEFEYVGVRTYDEAAGLLVPEAMSPAFDDLLEEQYEIDPANHPFGSVFFADEARIFDSNATKGLDESLRRTIPSVAVVPVGGYGIILVGASAERSIDDIDLEMVELLAANAEAVIDRFRREREIEELDREIASREIRIQELEEWMTAIDSIQQRVAESRTREQLEARVCEALVGVGSVDFAWVGHPEPEDRNIAPSAWAGRDTGYLEAVDPESGGNDLPCRRAAIERSLVAVPNISRRIAREDWARAALSRDFRSVVSMPLEHDGVLYGVLTAYSRETSAFGQLAESLFEDVAALLSTSYPTLSIRSMAAASGVVELELELRDPSLPVYHLSKAAGATIEFDTVLETTEEAVRVLMTVTDGDPETVYGRADGSRRIAGVSWFGDREDEQLALDLPRPVLAESVTEHGGQIRAIRTDPSAATVRIEVGHQASVRPLIEWLTTQYESVDVIAKRDREQTAKPPADSPETYLTDRQLQILKAAYYGGYYETPKGVTGTELASNFDISRPAVYNHLQAAQRKLLGKIFDREADPSWLTM